MWKMLTIALALAGPAQAEYGMTLTPDWEFVADTVMGGVSTGTVTQQDVAGRPAVRLTGDVSTANDGGFIQMAADVGPPPNGARGIAFDVLGNGETYELRLRTTALTRPWQSFRAPFVAPSVWTEVRLDFSELEPHKTEAEFDPTELRRIGLVAVGRDFRADLAVANLRFIE
ncbi:CIA30 family protein [Jannaschia marina]|uniref:CIA30 family protein n=1 Tax=Jannaschia marina TaxID=2741674 RepID=UPI001F407FD9|nr:CIA30 family protein [Jannaschia marina]